MKRRDKKYTCIECGTEFWSGRWRKYCRDCSDVVEKRRKKISTAGRWREVSAITSNIKSALESGDDFAICDAVEKPWWCSDVRWRMELSRREKCVKEFGFVFNPLSRDRGWEYAERARKTKGEDEWTW